MNLFITFEGLDGAGKSTQSRLLKEYFENKNIPSVSVFEPGSTDLGNLLRDILKNSVNIDPIAETYLFATARSQLTREIIEPALKQGKIVICDRFIHSSFAYQGAARGLTIPLVERINECAVSVWPDITFFINTSVEESMTRKQKRGELPDRIEEESITFRKNAYLAYRQMVKEGKMIEINGHDTVENIHKCIVKYIEVRL